MSNIDYNVDDMKTLETHSLISGELTPRTMLICPMHKGFVGFLS